MTRPRRNNCPQCSSSSPEFDAHKAFEMLNQRTMSLARLLAERVLDATGQNTLHRIVGGQETPEFPECCLVGRRHYIGSPQWFCTGVLVHPRIVLTAAHCHEPPAVPNVVGLGMRDMNDASEGTEIVAVKRVESHPAYTSFAHDIAVLVLRRDAKVDPIEIATFEQMSTATQTTLAGFGNNDLWSTGGFGVKRKVTVPISSLRRRLDDDMDADEERFDFESDLEFVAGGDGFDSCHGDSGGPAYISVDGQRKVAGLTSRSAGNPVLPCGEGSVNTRCDVHLEFIREVASKAGIAL